MRAASDTALNLSIQLLFLLKISTFIFLVISLALCLRSSEENLNIFIVWQILTKQFFQHLKIFIFVRTFFVLHSILLITPFDAGLLDAPLTQT